MPRQRWPWRQHMLHLPDSPAAESTARTHLAPTLNRLQDDGLINRWWYIRKVPGWRLRYQADEAGAAAVRDLLTGMANDHHLIRWRDGIYEPETLAFGGPTGMDIAHTLFHADSRHLLTFQTGLGRRETAVLLFGALLRAAGQDWFEQGDAWAKVTELRPPRTAHALGTERRDRLEQAVRRLMTTDPASAPETVLPGAWTSAFTTAGQHLASLARRGGLHRGIRAILAHHFIFHGNRAGLSGADQATLAALATSIVFHSDTRPDTAGSALDARKVRAMTSALSTTPTAPSPEELRNQLTDTLVKDDTIRTRQVEDAIRTVPRHLFVPGVPLTEAYADDAVYTKTDGSGTSISAASQPRIVALMLEQLHIAPAQRILELGAGTGYNAALMGHLTGPEGQVTTIDVDDDLVDSAAQHLTAADATNVDVVLADGVLGHPDGAPYDRVIATVGAWEVPVSWLEQLAPTGRLVVPLRLAGAASRSITFEREGDGWVSRDSHMAVFMPLRGIGDDARRIIDLTGDGRVTLQAHKDNQHATDARALLGVLEHPAYEEWTGVHFVPMESFEWLDLWLACCLDNPLMRMNVEPAAKESGLVRPMFPAVAMSTTAADGSLAYLTIRRAAPTPDGGRRFEVGVIGHGPTGQQLAEHVSREITAWDSTFRNRTVRFALPDTSPAPAQKATGRFVLDRPHRPLTITWQ